MGRHATWGGIIGPLAFIAAWSVGGAVTSRDYSPARDTISQLAAVDAPTRWLMTSGMVVFGFALLAYAIPLRRALPGSAWIAAGATGATTLGVAATPIDHSPLVDRLHLLAAGPGYITLALIPLLARRPLLDAGHGRLAVFGVAMATVAIAALPVSLFVVRTGLFQRIGLTAGDAFLIASVPVVRTLLTNRT